MKDLRLAVHTSENEEPVVDGEVMLVGQALMGHCLARRLLTARALLSALRAFPSSFQGMGWSAEDAHGFERRLVEALTGVLPDEVLNPPERVVRAMGACIGPAPDRAARFAAAQEKILATYADTFRQLAGGDTRKDGNG